MLDCQWLQRLHSYGLLSGSFPDFELSIIRERTKAGMRSAKARGSQIGPKKRPFDSEKATRLRDHGWGQIRIARELGVGVGRVNRWCKEEYLPPDRRGG